MVLFIVELIMTILKHEDTMNALEAKLKRLDDILRGYDKLALALACPRESMFLGFYAQRLLGFNAPVFMADAEIFDDADKLLYGETARAIGLELFLTPTREMHNLDFIENNARRCGYCRRYVLGALAKTAIRFGANTVAVGLTADSLDAQPGEAACLREQGVVAPLAAAGVTGAEVAALAAQFGFSLPTIGGCLAQNFARGEPLDGDALRFLARARVFLAGYNLKPAHMEIIGANAIRIFAPANAVNLTPGMRNEILAFMRKHNFTIVQWEQQ